MDVRWPRRVATAALVFGAQGGCAPIQHVSTEVVVRDPSAVALRSAGGAEVLAATSTPSEALLGAGRFETAPGSSAAYEVRARREDDRSLSVAWTTTLPLSNGDRHTVLPASGSVTLDAPLAAVVNPATRVGEHITLPWCTTLARRSERGYGYGVEPRGCIGEPASAAGWASATVRYTLDVPWSDVVEVRERTRVEHWQAWMIVAVSTLAFGAFTVMFSSFSPEDISGGRSTQVAFGVVTIATGLAFDLTMLPTLLARDHDVVVRR